MVQTTRMMIVHIATLGPESQSHQVSPNGPPAVSARRRRVGVGHAERAEQQVQHAPRVGEPLAAR